jgi:FKBP-type peptidyl-prolyl cis-trans isomerase
MKPMIFLTAAALAAAIPAVAADKPAMTDEQKIAHVIGRQIGQNLRSQGLIVDVPAFSDAVKESLDGKPDTFTAEENQQTVQLIQKKSMDYMQAEAAKNKTAGDAFLKANAKKKGVKTAKSGLQYREDRAGKGAHPKAEDRVKVNYRGTLLDGTEFDSSYKRNQPAEFPLNGVIPGWTEGLQLMQPGAKFTFYIPANLAYGEQGRPGIPPNATLVFEVEMLEILK